MFNWDVFVRDVVTKSGYKIFLEGLLNTVVIAVFGLIFGFILGSFLAVIKVVPSRKKPVVQFFQRLADIYITVFRGTPMAVQLLIIHFVLFPVIGLNIKNIVISPTFAIKGVVIEAIIAFALNSAAYISEIMRGGINSVDIGQLEAGRAVGLSYGKTMVSIIIPQAFKNVLPTLGNEFIALIKETSVTSFIAVTDLTKAFENIAQSSYKYLIPYLMLALTYLILVIGISAIVKAWEKKLKKQQR